MEFEDNRINSIFVAEAQIMSLDSKHFNSAFSVDNVIFGFDKAGLKILLIKKSYGAFKDMWALPGDHVRNDEDLDVSPRRVLKELTGLTNVFLEQVRTFGKVARHPLGRVITVAYYSLINVENAEIRDPSDAESVEWHYLSDIENLAYDHDEIVRECLKHLKSNLRVKPIGFELLPEKFTLSEIQSLYETVTGKELDKRNFRKKFLSMDVLQNITEYQKGVAHRPARLYQFDKEKYEQMQSKGFLFEI